MIFLGEQTWTALLDAFIFPKEALERVAFLDGIVIDGTTFVTTVTVPNACLHRRYYDVSAEAMTAAAAHLKRHSLRRTAQVHTHGGRWIDHSERDDERAYSQKSGSLSIVLPFHARHRPRLDESAVHLREPAGWRRLPALEIAQVVQMLPSLVDLRP